MKLRIAAILFAVTCSNAMAEDIPACALSGSPSVMIGGKPALRLSDTANCPSELIEPIAGIMLDGQPLVHVLTGKSAETTCLATGDATVIVSGKQAQGVGNVLCKQ